MIIKLTKNQFNYLDYNLFKKNDLILKFKAQEKNEFIFLELDRDTVDEIRDWAMDKQVKTGFDINYELTPEGKILEELINVFYIE